MTVKKTNYKTEEGRKLFRARILYAAAQLFLEKGYTKTSNREIAERAQVNISSMNISFGSKENILCELVEFVLDRQFAVADGLLQGVTDDMVLKYAAETTLQLHMAESDEYVRDLYAAAYSMPRSSAIIQQLITEKLQVILHDYHPDYDTKDFYKLEIATGGIMRGFMTIPCDMWFTMEHKVEAFISSAFHVLGVPEEKIEEAVVFVSQFDFAAIAKQTIQSMLNELKRLEAELQLGGCKQEKEEMWSSWNAGI